MLCWLKKYIDTVYRVAYNYLKVIEDAEDVTQNTFLKLLKEKKSFESEEHIRYWLIRVAINECKNTLHYQFRRQIPISPISVPYTFDNTEQSDLFFAVMELPKKYRLPIYLHYYEGYSTQEVGKLLNLPRNTVCTHLSRGREKLKRMLSEVRSDA